MDRILSHIDYGISTGGLESDKIRNGRIVFTCFISVKSAHIFQLLSPLDVFLDGLSVTWRKSFVHMFHSSCWFLEATVFNMLNIYFVCLEVRRLNVIGKM